MVLICETKLHKSPVKITFHGAFSLCDVIATGFEPVTVCLEGRCSIQLSYATIFYLEPLET
jgi:hypothetical protein